MLSSEWRAGTEHWPGSDPKARVLGHRVWVLCCRHQGVGTGLLTRLLHLLFCLSMFRDKCMCQNVSIRPWGRSTCSGHAERSVGTLPPRISHAPDSQTESLTGPCLCLLQTRRVPPTPRLSHESSYQVQKLRKAQCYKCIFIFGD